MAKNNENSLEVKLIDSSLILSSGSTFRKKSEYPSQLRESRTKAIESLEAGKPEDIEPIIVLKNPYETLEQMKQVYEAFKRNFPEHTFLINEDEIMKEIFDGKHLICYNGNIRLEEFQKRKMQARAMVVDSQESFAKIPGEEKIIPEEMKFAMPQIYTMDQNYEMAYVMTLRNAIKKISEGRKK
jgi:hypothetical protein